MQKLLPVAIGVVIAGLLILGSEIIRLWRYNRNQRRVVELKPATVTFVWRDEHNPYLQNVFAGTVEGFDDWLVWVEDKDGYCCLIDTRTVVRTF